MNTSQKQTPHWVKWVVLVPTIFIIGYCVFGVLNIERANTPYAIHWLMWASATPLLFLWNKSVGMLFGAIMALLLLNVAIYNSLAWEQLNTYSQRVLNEPFTWLFPAIQLAVAIGMLFSRYLPNLPKVEEAK